MPGQARGTYRFNGKPFNPGNKLLSVPFNNHPVMPHVGYIMILVRIVQVIVKLFKVYLCVIYVPECIAPEGSITLNVRSVYNVTSIAPFVTHKASGNSSGGF